MTSTFLIEERGKLFTESYRLYFKNGANQVISPFHDIPLRPTETPSSEGESIESNDLFNMVVEVPKWSNAKMEISKSQPMNPIMQDVKKGKVRFVGNVFPHRGYIWNYGAFPQTWEDPSIAHSETGTTGDNDPLDVCDISNIISPRGAVIQVKVLGVLLMIDEGETDWKVIAINSADPLAQHMEDITDVEKYKPGLLHATIEWFKYYKVPDGKPTNSFGFKNQFKNRKFALDVITETNHQWLKLLKTPQEEGSEDVGISRSSITVNESPFVITSEQSQEYLESEPAHDAEPAPIEDTKALDSFFINAATIPVAHVEVTSMDVCGDTLESPAVVENGEEAPEPASEAEVPATEEMEVAAVEPSEAANDSGEAAAPESMTEETADDAEVENGIADNEGVQNGHANNSAADNGETIEFPTEEIAPEEKMKDKPTEAVDQEMAEGAPEESNQ